MTGVNRTKLVFVTFAVAIPAGPALADGHCPDLGFETEFLNAYFCQRLQETIDTQPDTPTRNYVVPNEDAQRFIDELPLVQEAFQADPRRTLDLLDRIRSAGGTTSE